MHRHDLSPASATNYRHWLTRFDRWCALTLEREAVVGDVEPGTVDAYLAELRLSSPDGANSTWVALRSFAGFLAERKIHHDHGESVLRVVRRPKVKDKHRRAFSDVEMWRVIEISGEGEQGGRDRTVIWTLLGSGLRRGELVGLQLGDVNLAERLLHVEAATSKSIHARDVAIPVELVKELDHYMQDVRVGDKVDDAPLFVNRRGGPLTGNAIRLLFDRLKVRTASRICARTCSGTPGRRTTTVREAAADSICRSKAAGTRHAWRTGTARSAQSTSAAVHHRCSRQVVGLNQRNASQRSAPHSR
jgi:site-specific recombinase XerD